MNITLNNKQYFIHTSHLNKLWVSAGGFYFTAEEIETGLVSELMESSTAYKKALITNLEDFRKVVRYISLL